MRHNVITLCISSNTLQGIVHNHLQQKVLKFYGKEIGIDISYDGSKLFTTIQLNTWVKIILGSTHPHRYDVFDFLIERDNHLQDQAWQA